MEGTGLTKHLGGIAVSALLAVALAVSPAWAVKLTVHLTKPADFNNIQAAINAAAPGDEVFVKKGGGTGLNGEYHEPFLRITKRIKFICQKGAIIDGAIPSGVLSGPNSPAGPLALRGHGLLVFHFPGLEAVVAPALASVPARLAHGTEVRNCTFQYWRGSDGSTPPNVPEFYTFGTEGDCLRIGRRDGPDKGFVIVDASDDPDDPFFPDPGITDRTALVEQTGGVNDVIVKKNHFIGCEDDGLDLRGQRFEVVKNKSMGHNDDGFKFDNFLNEADVDRGPTQGLIKKNFSFGNGSAGSGDGYDMDCGSNNQWIGNDAHKNVDDGFDLRGGCNEAEAKAGDNVFTRNEALANGEEGWDINEDGDKFFKNKAISNQDDGYDIDGDSHEMDRNLGYANHDEGFDIDGNGLTFTKNRAEKSFESGVEYDCDATPPCGLVDGNTSTLNAGKGFEFDNQDGLVVSNNKSINNKANGFDCDDCEDVTMKGNLALENGKHGFRDFDCQGGKFTYTNNRSIKNAQDGFNSKSDDDCPKGVTFDGNLAQENGHDGIDIDDDESGNPYTVKNNRLIRNHGTGLENEEENTSVTNNTWIKNRTDFAGLGDSGDGTVGTFSGNSPIPPATGGVNTCTPGTGDSGDNTDCS